jgi:hypothetical protein
MLLTIVALTLSACSEPGVGPNDPMARAPTVQLTHLGGDPATDDLCGGLSPCDAYDYRGDGSVGAPGMCFLPPTVDNHLSDPACSALNQPGLGGIFQLAWCRVEYTDPSGATPPAIVPGTCQDPSHWQDLVDGGGHYTASLQWRRNEADDGDVFRVYVVRGERSFAYRDVVIDPNLTTPADDYVHAIGYGTEPFKVRITEDFSCIKFDTQGGAPENAATCIISGATSVSFQTDRTITTFNFPDGNQTFLADFEVSECLSLGFFVDAIGGIDGNALVDTPLADCKISVSSEEIATLLVPGQIQVTLTDERWSDDPAEAAPFEHARLNVLQHDEFGIGVLPPSGDPGWFGAATSSSAMLRWLGWGLERLADLVLPEPLYALRGAGWDFTRMSDFQVAVMPVMAPASSGMACASGEQHCLDLGTFSGTDPVPVSAQVSAPTAAGPTSYPANHIDVPDTRLHFFPESGTVSCPAGSMPGTYGRGCVEAGDPDVSTAPASFWDHLVVITGPDGLGSVDWSLAGGDNALHVSACGVARPGSNEPNPPGEPGGDDVWGDLGECTDREVAMGAAGAYDNGPADGFTPFEPVDVENEVAIYGLPLRFEARMCPQIQVDGVKADAFGTAEWEACAEPTVFTAPLQGPKVSNNATLWTYSDGTALYLGLEVATSDLGNRIFVNLVESFASGDGVEAAGDELLVIDFGVPSTPVDWHYTQACVGNNAASLCGEIDAGVDGAAAADGAASVDGAGSGRVFYEFVRPLGSPNAVAGAGKEDLGVGIGDEVGLRVRVTQGQGGGKGGFVYPDPQTSPVKYHRFTLD